MPRDSLVALELLRRVQKMCQAIIDHFTRFAPGTRPQPLPQRILDEVADVNLALALYLEVQDSEEESDA